MCLKTRLLLGTADRQAEAGDESQWSQPGLTSPFSSQVRYTAVGLAISPSIDSSVDTVASSEDLEVRMRSRKEGSGSFDGHCVC